MAMRPTTDAEFSMLRSSLERLQYRSWPFPHATTSCVFTSDTASALKSALHGTVTWGNRQSDKMCYDSCDDIVRQLENSNVAWTVQPIATNIIKHYLSGVFRKSFQNDRYQVAAHRMIAGHWIGPHNDMPGDDRRTHRFVVMLTDVSTPSGGELVLLGSNEAICSSIVVPPEHNTAVAMEFSSGSYHRINRVNDGVRYAMIYSFWAEQ